MRYLLTILAFMLSANAFAVSFSAPVVTTATGTSTMVMAPNGKRLYFIIQNTGSVGVIVKLGSVQTAHEGILIAAGGSYEPIQAPTNGVWVESVSSTAAITLVQGQ